MLKRFWVMLLLSGMLLLASPDAKAQTKAHSDNTFGIPGATNGMAAGAIGGVAGAAAVITFVVIHEHNVHTLRGCVASDGDGLLVKNEGDKRSYALTGDTAGIKAGERVKLSGKKMKSDKDHRQFAVKKLAKDYGACKL